jgi:hypothetical protein
MAKIQFKWVVARPDWRQYRQNSSEFEPQDVLVEVDIPGEEGLVVGQEKKTVILTPAGMFLALESLQAAFKEPKKEADAEEGWGDTTTKTEKKEKKVAAPASDDDEDDDGWGDSDEETVVEDKTKTSGAADNTDAPWDENSEDWEA